jgi:predicted RND superfamily exporter protein
LSRIANRIELWFEALGHFVFRHRWLTLFFILALVGAVASQLPRIDIDTSTESYLHRDDPILLRYNEFRRQFGRDEFIIIGIEPSELFSQDFLKKLKGFHEDLENNVPHVKEVISMVNARNTRGEQDRLVVEGLLEKWPEDEAGMRVFKERVLSNQLYINSLISEDGRLTAVVVKTDVYSDSGNWENALEGFDEATSSDENSIEADTFSAFDEEVAQLAGEPPFLTDTENHAIVEAIRKIVGRYQAPDFQLYLTGSPVVTDLVRRSLLRDANRFVKLVILIISVCLFIMFHCISGVLLPLLVVACALVSTLGLMPIFDVPFTVPSNILPSFILAVGIGDSVHILSVFYRRYQKTGDREVAICQALGHSGLAIVLTSLTTAAGLASFATADVAPIAHLGIFSSIGVLLALVYSILLLPSLLSIIPVTAKYSVKSTTSLYFVDSLLLKIADFAIRHCKTITILAFFIITISLTGLFRLSFSHNPMLWFPKSMQIRGHTEKVDQELKGTVVLEVIIDTGRENGLYDPDILNMMEALARETETFRKGKIFIGKATSMVDILKELHQALNENRPNYYTVPQDPQLISQEFLLFENSGSDDLKDVADSQFSQARFTIKVPWGDAIEYMPCLKVIENRFKEAFAGKAEIAATGMMSLLVRVLYAAIYSAAKSYIIAFGVISLMMILLVRSLRIGLLTMVPNLLPIVLSLGVIGWLVFPLDMFTMLIGSIAIGLAVDDTVHFMHNYSRYYYATGDICEAVRLTLLTAGQAMVVTTIVLSSGFFIYMFATMKNLFYFGLITGITIITALLADLVVTPALMALGSPPVEPFEQGAKGDVF